MDRNDIAIVLTGVTIHFNKGVGAIKAMKVVAPVCEIVGCKPPKRFEKVAGESFMKGPLEGRRIGAHLLRLKDGSIVLDIDHMVAYPDEVAGEDTVKAFGMVVKHYRDAIRHAVISIDYIREPSFSLQYDKGDDPLDVFEDRYDGNFSGILDKYSIPLGLEGDRSSD